MMAVCEYCGMDTMTIQDDVDCFIYDCENCGYHDMDFKDDPDEGDAESYVEFIRDHD